MMKKLFFLLLISAAALHAMELENGENKRLIQAIRDNNNGEVGRLCYRNIANINQPCDGMTPLEWAIFFKNVEAVHIILDRQANPNSRHCDSSVLEWAIMRNDLAMVRELVQAGAHVRWQMIKKVVFWFLDSSADKSITLKIIEMLLNLADCPDEVYGNDFLPPIPEYFFEHTSDNNPMGSVTVPDLETKEKENKTILSGSEIMNNYESVADHCEHGKINKKDTDDERKDAKKKCGDLLQLLLSHGISFVACDPRILKLCDNSLINYFTTHDDADNEIDAITSTSSVLFKTLINENKTCFVGLAASLGDTELLMDMLLPEEEEVFYRVALLRAVVHRRYLLLEVLLTSHIYVPIDLDAAINLINIRLLNIHDYQARVAYLSMRDLLSKALSVNGTT